MTEQEKRAVVVKEALTWEKTPFHWEASIKGVGVDCGRFPAMVFNGAGVKKIDLSTFPKLSPQWFLHTSEPLYLNELKKYSMEYELQFGQIPQPGDIVIARYGRDWAHTAIVVEWPKVVAAAAGFCVTVWQDIFKSPQYAQRKLKYLNPFHPEAGGNA